MLYPTIMLPDLPLVVLDTETTGFLPRVHRVIELAMVRADGGKIAEEYEQLFAIPGEIPPYVEVLTRIRTKDLADKPTFTGEKENILQHLPQGALLVGQNLQFDMEMLRGEGIDLQDRPRIDTSMLASLVFPELASYSLGYLSTVLKLRHEPKHRALGDVYATLELLGRCYERLLELPEGRLETLRDIFNRSSPGLASLAKALPRSGKQECPDWFCRRERSPHIPGSERVTMPSTAPGTVTLLEESLSQSTLQQLLLAAAEDKNLCLFAVKNLENILRRFELPPGVCIMHPARNLLEPTAAKDFLAQTTFTADEAYLAVKLAWFTPKDRFSVALHGGERDVWYGKLACTPASETYRAQFAHPPNVLLLDHLQLLEIVKETGTFAGKGDRPFGREGQSPANVPVSLSTIIIDDASMLEDTTTKALGAYCNLDELRAGAVGDSCLMKLTDLAMLWAERTRAHQDLMMLKRSDLETPEAKGMRELIAEALKRNDLAPRLMHSLEQLALILDPTTLPGSLVWIECRLGGALHLHRAPETVDRFLADHVLLPLPSVLLSPRNIRKLPGILPEGTKISVAPAGQESPAWRLDVSHDTTLHTLLEHPPAGKTLVLAGSKRIIEEAFVRHTEALEKLNVTLICQGFNGGQGRMEAEFLAAEGTAILMVTPWMYEGMDFAGLKADRLVIDTLPFDHPSHPVFKCRSDRMRSGFGDYSLPRLLMRLFRVLRNFSHHSKPDAEVLVLDPRIATKSYGGDVRRYLESLVATPSIAAQPSLL